MGEKTFLSFFFLIIFNIIFSQEISANNSLCKKYFIESYKKTELSKPDSPIDIEHSAPHLEIYGGGKKNAVAYFVLFDENRKRCARKSPVYFAVQRKTNWRKS